VIRSGVRGVAQLVAHLTGGYSRPNDVRSYLPVELKQPSYLRIACAREATLLDPRFTPSLRESLGAAVFYLYRSLAEIHTADVKGSGVLVGLPVGNPVTQWMMYLVAPASIVATGVASVGRMNRKGGGIFPLATSTDTWHAPDPDGLAVCLVGLVWDNVDFRFVPLRPHCADKDFFGRFGIKDGHQMAAIGPSPARAFADRNEPQVFGTTLMTGTHGAFELAVDGGHELLPGAAILGFTDDAAFDQHLLGMESPYWGPWLVGLSLPIVDGSAEQRTGILPVTSLHALLNSPYIKEQRHKHLQALTDDEPRVTAVAGRPIPMPQSQRKRRPTSSKNLHAFELYQMITRDFETAWNAMAGFDSGGDGRGNFMFCRQAMSLLEWVGNVCKGDPTGSALASVSAALAYIDRRYFTVLPSGAGISDAHIAAVPLPTAGRPKDELLAIVFDLALSDGTDFSVRLTGVELGRTLDEIQAERPERTVLGRIPTNTTHLTYTKQDGAILLTVSPPILYLDLKRAIELSGLLSHVAEFPYLTVRGRYKFTSQSLEEALRQGGHPEFKRPR